jgi:hypothetical protein
VALHFHPETSYERSASKKEEEIEGLPEKLPDIFITKTAKACQYCSEVVSLVTLIFMGRYLVVDW